MRVLPVYAAALIAAAPASAETLVTSLSSSRVLINSNYTGASIVVFGAIERDAQTVSRAAPYDVVVTVRGPPQFVTVREKERLGVLWLNSDQQKFPNAPAYLSVLTSRPLPEIADDFILQRHRLGLRAIVYAPDFTNRRGPGGNPFREALLRLKAREGLYEQHERGVTFLTEMLFRAPIGVPATAPPGNYDVDVLLLADTGLLARTTTHFELVKTDFEQQVGEVAREWSVLYGLTTASAALLFGYLASVVFRRD